MFASEMKTISESQRRVDNDESVLFRSTLCKASRYSFIHLSFEGLAHASSKA